MILWSGCRLRGQQIKRVPPIPVVVRLMYSGPYPADAFEVEQRMMDLRRRAVREWIEGYRKHGVNLEGSP